MVKVKEKDCTNLNLCALNLAGGTVRPPSGKGVRPLGIQNRRIGNHQITATSVWDRYHAAHLARLHNKRRGRSKGGWSARYNNRNQWIQVSDDENDDYLVDFCCYYNDVDDNGCGGVVMGAATVIIIHDGEDTGDDDNDDDYSSYNDGDDDDGCGGNGGGGGNSVNHGYAYDNDDDNGGFDINFIIVRTIVQDLVEVTLIIMALIIISCGPR